MGSYPGDEDESYLLMYEKYGKQDLGKDVLDDTRRVAMGTKAERTRAMRSFKIFCALAGRCHEDTLTNLCFEDEDAFRFCRMFLRWYVDDYSKTKVLTLGPEEFEWRGGTTCVNTIMNVWVRILADFDSSVLAKRRRLERDGVRRQMLRLIQPSCKGGVPSRTYPIKMFIVTELAEDHKLSKRPWQFEKNELVGADAIILHETWYLRAAVLPRHPRTRQSYHALSLIETMTGCRPGALEEIRYNDLQVLVLRDPTDGSNNLGANVTLRRTKQQQGSMYVKESLKFTVFFTQCPTICLLSLIIARAIGDNAFESDPRTVEELTANVAFEKDQHWLPLPFKSSVEKKPIFSLAYETYRDCFQSCALAAGYRNPVRPYGWRVGAGNAFDGVLSSTGRNHILDQSSETFLRSYQTARTKFDLSTIIFGKEDSHVNNDLFEQVRKQSTYRVPNVPIRLRTLKEKLAEFGSRRDVTQLIADVDAALDPDEKRKARARLTTHLNALQALQIKAEMQEYIKQSDRQRGRGIVHESPGTDRIDLASEGLEQRIGVLLERSRQADARADLTQIRSTYIALQCALIGQRCVSEVYELPALHATAIVEGQMMKCFRCLLCNSTLKSRYSLTRHTTGKHSFLLSTQHKCPNCSELIAAGADRWSAHVERRHRGETVAPNISSEFVNCERSLRSG